MQLVRTGISLLLHRSMCAFFSREILKSPPFSLHIIRQFEKCFIHRDIYCWWIFIQYFIKEKKNNKNNFKKKEKLNERRKKNKSERTRNRRRTSFTLFKMNNDCLRVLYAFYVVQSVAAMKCTVLVRPLARISNTVGFYDSIFFYSFILLDMTFYTIHFKVCVIGHAPLTFGIIFIENIVTVWIMSRFYFFYVHEYCIVRRLKSDPNAQSISQKKRASKKLVTG